MANYNTSNSAYWASGQSNFEVVMLADSSGNVITPSTGGSPYLVSTLNSTSVALDADETFTGTWEEVAEYASMTFAGQTDVDATLFVDSSTDGVNVDRTVQLTGGGVNLGIHTLIPITRYIRVRIVNGSVAASYTRMQTLFHRSSKIAIPTSRINTTLDSFSDAINVKLVNDTKIDVASGRNIDRRVVYKFGENSSIPASNTKFITPSGNLNFLTSASPVRIRAGGSTDDASAGTGAREIFIEGLDENWNLATAAIASNGSGVSAATSNNFIRVYRAYVSSTGTYGGTNAANVIIETTSGTELIQINAGISQSEHAAFSVPAGYTAYVKNVYAKIESNKPGEVSGWLRTGADVTSAPYTAARRMFHITGFENEVFRPFEALTAVPPKSDIWFSGTAGPTGVTAMGVSFDIEIVRDV